MQIKIFQNERTKMWVVNFKEQGNLSDLFFHRFDSGGFRTESFRALITVKNPSQVPCSHFDFKPPAASASDMSQGYRGEREPVKSHQCVQKNISLPITHPADNTVISKAHVSTISQKKYAELSKPTYERLRSASASCITESYVNKQHIISGGYAQDNQEIKKKPLLISATKRQSDYGMSSLELERKNLSEETASTLNTESVKQPRQLISYSAIAINEKYVKELLEAYLTDQENYSSLLIGISNAVMQSRSSITFGFNIPLNPIFPKRDLICKIECRLDFKTNSLSLENSDLRFNSGELTVIKRVFNEIKPLTLVCMSVFNDRQALPKTKEFVKDLLNDCEKR